jgi:hypothetical protein
MEVDARSQVLERPATRLPMERARSTSYRSTGEAVKHERYLYLAAAGPGAGATDRVGLLAERVEGLLVQENARWTSSQDKARESAGRAAAAVSRLGTRQ